jgi:hypothetical protein
MPHAGVSGTLRGLLIQTVFQTILQTAFGAISNR